MSMISILFPFSSGKINTFVNAVFFDAVRLYEVILTFRED